LQNDDGFISKVSTALEGSENKLLEETDYWEKELNNNK